MLLTGTTYVIALHKCCGHCTAVVMGCELNDHDIASLPGAQWRLVNSVAYIK